MEKRLHDRFDCRVECEVTSAHERFRGIVNDVSSLGLFVETWASPELNSIIRLRFGKTEKQPEFSLNAGVARKNSRGDEQSFANAPGIGLAILPPRSSFERFIVEPAQPTLGLTLAPLGSQTSGTAGTFRVRLIRQDRPGTQILTLRCENEATARVVALARLGGVWRVAESQPL
jgi:hypothetical protein